MYWSQEEPHQKLMADGILGEAHSEGVIRWWGRHRVGQFKFFVHICTHVYVQAPVYGHEEARGKLRIFCSITLPILCLSQGLLLSLELGQWPGSCSQSSCLCLLQQWNCHPGFHMGTQDSNSGFHALVANALTYRGHSPDPVLHFITIFSENKGRSYRNYLIYYWIQCP